MLNIGFSGALFIYRVSPSLLCSCPAVKADIAMMSILLGEMKTDNTAALLFGIIAIVNSLFSLMWLRLISFVL